MATIPVLKISSVKKGRPKKEPIKEKDLQRFNLIHKFIPLLERFHLVRDHHNRELHLNQYISLILFYFFFSFLSSLHGIQQVSHLDKVKKMLDVKGTSLSFLSEASSVFDADQIAPLIKELANKAIPLEKDPKLKSLQQALVAMDGTLLPALPKSALKHYGLMTNTRQLNFILKSYKVKSL